MAKKNLTAQFVERAKPPKSGLVEIIDAGYPGLAFRMSYGGQKSWQFLYTWQGKSKRLALGTYPDVKLERARDLWRAARTAVRQNRLPSTVPEVTPAAGDTFGTVLDEWLAIDQAGNRSRAEVERLVKKATLEHWKDRPISDLKLPEIIGLIDRVGKKTPTTARRLHSYLHRLLKWARSRGKIETNPLAGVQKTGKEIKRKRTLSDTELTWAWRAADDMVGPTGDAIKLMILTLCRRDEVGDLRWDEIDLERNEIRFEREDRHLKNGQAHIVPLSPMARKLLDGIAKIEESDFVFTFNGESPINSWSNTKEHLDRLMLEHAQAQAAKRGDNPAKVAIPPWRFHDLRRTGATGLGRLGIPQPVTEALLNHVGSKNGIAGVYQLHRYDEEKRQAVEIWARHVAALQRPQIKLVVG